MPDRPQQRGPESLQVEFDATTSLATAQVAGELDVRTASDLVAAVLDDTRTGPRHPDVPLVLRLSGVGFCDSAGLSVLVRIRRAYEAAGQSFRIVDATPTVRRLFGLTGLADYLNATDDQADDSAHRAD